MSDARRLAGEICDLIAKGPRRRTASDEKRLSDLYTLFGDHGESAQALIHAAMKGDPEATAELTSMRDKGN